MLASDLLKKLFTQTLIWSKKRHAPIVQEEAIQHFIDLHQNGIEYDVPKVSIVYRADNRPLVNIINDSYTSIIEKYLKDKHIIIWNILQIGKGKISICGGSIVDMISRIRFYGDLKDLRVKDFDLFFTCKDYLEADELLKECIKYLEESHICYYKVSQCLVEVIRPTPQTYNLLKEFIKHQIKYC